MSVILLSIYYQKHLHNHAWGYMCFVYAMAMFCVLNCIMFNMQNLLHTFAGMQNNNLCYWQVYTVEGFSVLVSNTGL